MKRKHFFIGILLFIALASFIQQDGRIYVPNEETAIKIAEAVWLPIYGDKIYSKKPFKAELLGDTIWHIYGSLPPSGKTVNANGDTVITIVRGGVPHAWIYKADARILRVIHDR